MLYEGLSVQAYDPLTSIGKPHPLLCSKQFFFLRNFLV